MKKLQKHLSEWAIEYGKGECSWVSNLDSEATINHANGFRAWSFGVACGAFALFFLLGNYGEFVETTGLIFIAVLGIVGLFGCLGPLINFSIHNSSPAEKYYKAAAQLKGRERRYSDKELMDVRKYQDWLRELHRSELREIRSGRIKWVKLWRMRKLDKSLRNRQISFFDIFLKEAKSLQHKWIKDEQVSFQYQATPFQRSG